MVVADINTPTMIKQELDEQQQQQELQLQQHSQALHSQTLQQDQSSSLQEPSSPQPQQQQQQQEQQEELPPLRDDNGAYDLTTPVWNNHVKGESRDDKNDDSGISPGYCTSETSSHRSSPSMPMRLPVHTPTSGGGSNSNTSSNNSSPAPNSLDPHNNITYPVMPSAPISNMDSDIHDPITRRQQEQLRLHQNLYSFPSTSSGIYDFSVRYYQGNSHGEGSSSSSSSSSGIPTPQNMSRAASMSPRLDENQMPTLRLRATPEMQFGYVPPQPGPINRVPLPTDDSGNGDDSVTDRNNNNVPEQIDDQDGGLAAGGHDETGADSNDEWDQPTFNAQGKIKVFHCKHCDFQETTKNKFWAHVAEHIKPERRLKCTRCSFVTEYKHHLEYHLRNHAGSKPFACPHCKYTCVNKSMLNSHLKSHSNVYQFRCANCAYATKYCHSLKLHLRKYQHNPAMVLNPDGTPNPLPIIDVYGTRRGPKTKPKKTPADQIQEQQEQQAQQQQLQQEQQAQQAQQAQQGQQGHPTQQQSPPPNFVPPVLSPNMLPQFNFNAMSGIHNFTGFQGTNNVPVAASLPFLGYPFHPMFAGMQVSNPFAVVAAAAAAAAATNLIGTDVNMPNAPPANYSPQAMMMNGGGILNSHSAPIGLSGQQSLAARFGSTASTISAPVDLTETRSGAHTPQTAVDAPLDLSVIGPMSAPESPESARTSQSASSSRRKGVAVRLDRRRLTQNDSDEEMPQEEEPQQQPQSPTQPQQQQSSDNYRRQIQNLRSDMHHIYRHIVRIQNDMENNPQ